jgi:hypothetical protein
VYRYRYSSHETDSGVRRWAPSKFICSVVDCNKPGKISITNVVARLYYNIVHSNWCRGNPTRQRYRRLRILRPGGREQYGSAHARKPPSPLRGSVSQCIYRDRNASKAAQQDHRLGADCPFCSADRAGVRQRSEMDARSEIQSCTTPMVANQSIRAAAEVTSLAATEGMRRQYDERSSLRTSSPLPSVHVRLKGSQSEAACLASQRVASAPLVLAQFLQSNYSSSGCKSSQRSQVHSHAIPEHKSVHFLLCRRESAMPTSASRYQQS